MDRAGDVRTPFTRLFPPKLQVCKDSSTALARVVFRGRFAAHSLNRRGILARSQILSLWSRRVNTRVCPTLATIQLELQAGNHTSVSLLVVQRCPARQLFTPSLTGPQWQSPSASDQPVELRPVNLSRDTVTFYRQSLSRVFKLCLPTFLPNHSLTRTYRATSSARPEKPTVLRPSTYCPPAPLSFVLRTQVYPVTRSAPDSALLALSRTKPLGLQHLSGYPVVCCKSPCPRPSFSPTVPRAQVSFAGHTAQVHLRSRARALQPRTPDRTTTRSPDHLCAAAALRLSQPSGIHPLPRIVSLPRYTATL